MRSKNPLFEEMTYAAMIGQSAEDFGAQSLVIILALSLEGQAISLGQ